MQSILSMYVTLMPVIFAGILNMAFVKSPYFNSLNIPMDNKRTLWDGKRLFGDNKTWKGFWGMVFFGVIVTVLWGLLCSFSSSLQLHNLLYVNNANTILFNGAVGFLLGLAYVVFELPNSFIKRRINIAPGKTVNGGKGLFFLILDQTDSLFGCVLVIALLYPMTVAYYFVYVALGGLTHIILNLLLYTVKLKKNI